MKYRIRAVHDNNRGKYYYHIEKKFLFWWNFIGLEGTVEWAEERLENIIRGLGKPDFTVKIYEDI